MASFRKEILGQIERIDTGRIFTFRDLSFETEKTANVAVLLSEQSRKGVLVRVEKGAYYRPKKSVLGLGKLPVYQDEQFRYLTEKLNGYITGAYVYNKMGLTEQVATTITIATPNPVRRFRFKNLDIECVKAYCMDYPVKSQYFNGYSLLELEKIVSLAKSYPPRVRKVVADILGDIRQTVLQTEMAKTILPTTRFNLDYKTRKTQLR